MTDVDDDMNDIAALARGVFARIFSYGAPTGTWRGTVPAHVLSSMEGRPFARASHPCQSQLMVVVSARGVGYERLLHYLVCKHVHGRIAGRILYTGVPAAESEAYTLQIGVDIDMRDFAHQLVFREGGKISVLHTPAHKINFPMFFNFLM